MIIKAPNKINLDPYKVSIFLAGSIEMGAAENWQDKFANSQKVKDRGYVLLNPRRDDWDSSWIQSYDDLNFRDQVSWEQVGLQRAGMVVFYFDPSTKSPISLLELGLAIGLKKQIIVCCSKEFWRYGNIEVMCHLNKISLYHNLEDLIRAL